MGYCDRRVTSTINRLLGHYPRIFVFLAWFPERQHPSGFLISNWSANGEIGAQCIINVKRSQRLTAYLRRNSNRNANTVAFQMSSGGNASVYAAAVISREARVTFAWQDPRRLIQAHGKQNPNLVDFSRILHYFGTGCNSTSLKSKKKKKRQNLRYENFGWCCL